MMAIARIATGCRCDGRRRSPPRGGLGGAGSVVAGEGLGDAGDDLALDELLLTARRLAESGGGEAVDLAQGPQRHFVQGREGVVGEQGALAPRGVEAETDVLGRVGDGGGGDEEAVVGEG